jgi:hypothetical protein
VEKIDTDADTDSDPDQGSSPETIDWQPVP